jgi:site-specific DNA-methyltransferase (adenine-specific)
MTITENDWETSLRWESPTKSAQLYQGDSLQLLASLPAESIDCIWTDPPYNLSNDGITCVGGRMVKVNKGDWDRSRGLKADYEFHRTWLKTSIDC